MHGGSKRAWRLMGFYGEPKTSKRGDGWSMLHMLSSKIALPWCCMGDFNEWLEVEDKHGGAPRSHNLMQAFREVLDDCGFVNLGYSGPNLRGMGNGGDSWCGNAWTKELQIMIS